MQSVLFVHSPLLVHMQDFFINYLNNFLYLNFIQQWNTDNSFHKKVISKNWSNCTPKVFEDFSVRFLLYYSCMLMFSKPKKWICSVNWNLIFTWINIFKISMNRHLYFVTSYVLWFLNIFNDLSLFSSFSLRFSNFSNSDIIYAPFFPINCLQYQCFMSWEYWREHLWMKIFGKTTKTLSNKWVWCFLRKKKKKTLSLPENISVPIFWILNYVSKELMGFFPTKHWRTYVRSLDSNKRCKFRKYLKGTVTFRTFQIN